MRRRHLRWFPRWTGTRWGTWTKAVVYLLAGAAAIAGVLYGIDGLSRLIALVYGPLAVVASARHVVGAIRWSDKPVPRRAQQAPAEVGLEIIGDGYSSTSFQSKHSSSGASDTSS